ncbi:unnamed protein product [Phytomonas sp. EM1]|nr:unnamed protein product [Phytomonas sp. EM1]|eukprot:CCW61212.1 unnamed protein product [Phytomonas sp. isolate EM1]
MVFTEDLNNYSRYCTKVGETRFDFMDSTRVCDSDEILTYAKKLVLRDVVIRDAVQMHEDRLLVQPHSGNIRVNRFTHGLCSHFTIPDSHYTTGVPNADLVLYVAAGPIKPGILAWAISCQVDASGRPLVGVVNVSPRGISNVFSCTRIMAHELLHALGFHGFTFETRGMVANVSVRGKPKASVITSSRVVQAARAHYGCSTMTHMELEDTGGSVSVGSHWKMRNAKDELMSPVIYAGFYTAMTIAAMEDTGYYKGNYSNAESMAWGKNAGCVLFNEKCVINGVSQVPEMFCVTETRTKSEYKCTSNRLDVGYCDLSDNMTHLSSIFQYFTNPTMGGTQGWTDYCPFVRGFWDAGCNDVSSKVLPGSVLSESARCFSALPSATLEISGGENMAAVCAHVLCEEATATYRVRVKGASDFVNCPRGGILVPSKYSAEFSSGAIECPPYDEVCTGNPSSAVGLLATEAVSAAGTPSSSETRCMAVFGTTGGAHHLTLMVAAALAGMVFLA